MTGRRRDLTPKLVIQWGQAICTLIVPVIVIFIYATERAVQAADITLITTLLSVSAGAHGLVKFLDSKDPSLKEEKGDGEVKETRKTVQRPRYQTVKKRADNQRRLLASGPPGSPYHALCYLARVVSGRAGPGYGGLLLPLGSEQCS